MFNLFPTINKYRAPVTTTMHTIPNPADMRQAALVAKKELTVNAFNTILHSIKQAAEEGNSNVSISSTYSSHLTDHYIGMLVAAGYRVEPTYASQALADGVTIHWK